VQDAEEDRLGTEKPAGLLRPSRLHWLPVGAAVALNFYLSELSWEEVRTSMGWVKEIPQTTNFKFRHIVQYLPQALLWINALRHNTRLEARSVALVALIAVTITGGLAEVHQAFVPSRIAAATDVLWNFIGGLMGVGLYMIFIKVSNRHR